MFELEAWWSDSVTITLYDFFCQKKVNKVTRRNSSWCLAIALVQLGKDKLAEPCRQAVLFPAVAVFFLDCQRGLQLMSSCRLLRRRGFGKNKFGKNNLCSPVYIRVPLGL
ncbi:MAG: hypothetical protein D3925_16940 [Candidatus Electrothrix sp. AR5]|nr:hypothetical protein [Candidatus Electrothrix sp. AR5]